MQMRILSALIATAVAVTAQSPLTTTFANNNAGSAGGAVYFELEALDPAGVTITDIDLHTTTVGLATTVDVYLQALPGGAGTMNPGGAWVGPVTTGSGTTAGLGVGSPFDLSPDLPLGPGCRFGVAIVANGFAHTYTTATAPFQLLYQTAELELLGGQASNAPFTAPFFVPRLVNTNIFYTSGGACPAVATVQSQGDGCVGSFTSFYELMTPVANDLAGTQINALNTGSGYVVSTQASTINPVGSLGAAMPGPVGDDVSLAVGTLGITVYSNGMMSFGAGNSTNWVPDVAVMLANPATALYAWTDLSPNIVGSGQISYEESGTQYQVTWDGVWAFGTTDPSTIQMRGDTATGDFTIACGALHTTGPEDFLFGYSVAGPSADPGPTDLSSLTGGSVLVTAATDNLPLTLTGVGRPVQGAAATNFDVTTSNIDANAIFHVGTIGLTRPGTPLSAVGFGPGDCFLNASVDVLVGATVVFGGPSTLTWTALPLPAAPPSFVGFEFNVQAATLDLSILSPAGRSSNGLKCVVGDI
jgi:predicted outer membrane repeat protein